MLAQHRVQVIIAAHHMPNMNGAELLDRVRQIHPEVVRIVLTGDTDMAAVTAAINQGNVYKFLTKPWSDEALRQTLRDAFAHYQRRRSPEPGAAGA